MERFLLVVNSQKDIGLTVTNRVDAYLKKRGCFSQIIVLESRDDDVALEKVGNFDCAVVLGGDGTILRVAKRIGNSHIPILGINMGHLGYLAEVEKEHCEAALDALCDNRFDMDDRMMLSGVVFRNEECICEAEALNDIVITRGGSLQVLSYELRVNEMFLKNYKADGVILATPTGSTAYNLSAGGPLAEPGADIMLVTPISPHTMMNKSFVLKASDEVSVTILPPHDADIEQIIEVNFDGSNRVKLQAHDRVVVSKSLKTVTLIRLHQMNFLETLHRKLREE